MSRPPILALEAGQERALLAELADILQDEVFHGGPEIDIGEDEVLAAVAHAFAALGVLETDGVRMRLTASRAEISRRIAEAPLEALPLAVDVLAVALHVTPAVATGRGFSFGPDLDAVLEALGMVDRPGGAPDATLQVMLIDLTLLGPVGGAWSEEVVVLLGEMARDLAASAPADVPRVPGSDPQAAMRLLQAIRVRSRCGHWLGAAELARPSTGRPWGVLPPLLIRAMRGQPI